jgi:type 1 fimbriae regulatory protein FimB/type 1 fimbriae regulatory protein FimE
VPKQPTKRKVVAKREVSAPRQQSFSAKSKKVAAKKKASAPRRRRTNSPPEKPRNVDVRSREYLTPEEAKKLREAARNIGRHGFRDWVLIMMAYRHGLRVGEIVALRWEQVEFKTAKLHVNRLKNGDPSVHWIEGDELRALRQLQREYPDSPFLFVSERGGPLSERTVHALVARAGEEARFKFPVHPHMLRHARGYALAAKGADTRAIQAYLGHKNIQHTVLYTQLDPTRFKGFAKD